MASAITATAATATAATASAAAVYDASHGVLSAAASLRDTFEDLLRPAKTLGYWPKEFRAFSVDESVIKDIENGVKYPCSHELFTMMHDMTYWESGILEFVWNCICQLQETRAVKGSEEWNRIVTPPTEEEWAAKEAHRKQAVAEDLATGGDRCLALAPLFAQLSVLQMVWYLKRDPEPARWAAITSTVPPAKMARVARQVLLEREEERVETLWRLAVDTQ